MQRCEEALLQYEFLKKTPKSIVASSWCQMRSQCKMSNYSLRKLGHGKH
jgi:hypothetical protein